jgi:enamine deaminase RidA (YjgF/YER057c/UK114 family)
MKDDSRDARFAAQEAALGLRFDGDMVIGGNYVSVIQHGGLAFVSGQVPRVGNKVLVAGRVGDDVSLGQAQHAARICAMRALSLLRQTVGSLDGVLQVLKVGVYVQSAADFGQQSEVADAASGLLHAVLGEAGRHTRTSVGVVQLPKNAAVELDLVAQVSDDRTAA